MIRLPNGEKRIMIGRFRHPKGLRYFEPFWHLGDPCETVRVAEGAIKGDGPKVGDCVVHVGCHDVGHCLATDFETWQAYLMENPEAYPRRAMIVAIAKARSALVETR